ncbi:MAG TPA: hypothetical protein VMG12_15330 [Polyangiaceae bacterium]|nr:hypothetical protein [Polyangiaceae bacterium]
MVRQHSIRRTSSLHVTALALSVGLSGALLAACNGEPVHDLGYTERDLSQADSQRPSSPPPPIAEFANDFVGVWVGEADDPLAPVAGADVDPPPFRFLSGSTQIRLELEADDGAFPTGTITFGEGAPLAPATDPNVGYPPDPSFSIADADALDQSARPPREGFAFGIYLTGNQHDYATAGLSRVDRFEFNRAGRVLDGKLDVNYTANDIFESWCALQTAATCPANTQVGWDETATECTIGDDLTPMDCHKAALCASNRCECPDEGPCRSNPEFPARLTLRLSNDGLVGLFDGLFVNERDYVQQIGTVHFQREVPALQP